MPEAFQGYSMYLVEVLRGKRNKLIHSALRLMYVMRQRDPTKEGQQALHLYSIANFVAS